MKKIFIAGCGGMLGEAFYKIFNQSYDLMCTDIDINEEWPKAYGEFRDVEYTPTFILVEDGQVIGRIIGYPGESFFWELLSQLLEKLPDTQTHACPGAGVVKAGGGTC